MRISDWSSDVCSSDLPRLLVLDEPTDGLAPVVVRQVEALLATLAAEGDVAILLIEQNIAEIGRASCRERVCQYVSISGVAVSLQKQSTTRALLTTQNHYS